MNGRGIISLVHGQGEAYTTLENPTLWFYIPYSREQVKYMEFSLHDEDFTSTLYRTGIELTQGPGLIKLRVPESALSEKNELYLWYFKLYCKVREK